MPHKNLFRDDTPILVTTLNSHRRPSSNQREYLSIFSVRPSAEEKSSRPLKIKDMLNAHMLSTLNASVPSISSPPPAPTPKP